MPEREDSSQTNGAGDCAGGTTPTGSNAGPNKKKDNSTRPTAASMHAEQMAISKKILDAITELCGKSKTTKVEDTPTGKQITMELNLGSMTGLLRTLGAPLLHLVLASLVKSGCHVDVQPDPKKVSEATAATGITPTAVAETLTLEVVNGRLVVLTERVDKLEARFAGMDDGLTVAELVATKVGDLKGQMVDELASVRTDMATGDQEVLTAAKAHTDAAITASEERTTTTVTNAVNAVIESVDLVEARMIQRTSLDIQWPKFFGLGVLISLAAMLIMVSFTDQNGMDSGTYKLMIIGFGALIGFFVAGAIAFSGHNPTTYAAKASSKIRVWLASTSSTTTTSTDNNSAATTANPPTPAPAGTGSGSGGGTPSPNPAPATSGTSGA